MKSILEMAGRTFLFLLMAGGASAAGAAAGDHLERGELLRLSPDGQRVGYVESHGDYTMLWVSSLTNPENRRPVTVWGAGDQAFDWADNDHLAVARRSGDGTVITVMSADGDGEPIQSPVLPGHVVSLSKDTIESVVVTPAAGTGGAVRYDRRCECFAASPSAGVAARGGSPQVDGFRVWSASWDGNVLLVSRGDTANPLPVYVYSPHTQVARPLFAGHR